jgi:hypothetical protein
VRVAPPEGYLGHIVPPVAGRVGACDIRRAPVCVRVYLLVRSPEPVGIRDPPLARGPLEQRAGFGLRREHRRPRAVPADPRTVAVNELASLGHGFERGVPFNFKQGLQRERFRRVDSSLPMFEVSHARSRLFERLVPVR